MAHRDTDLQLMLGKVSEISKPFGLTISLGKTEVLHEAVLNKKHS